MLEPEFGFMFRHREIDIELITDVTFFLTKLVRDRTASTARISRFGPTVPERKWPVPPTSVRLRIPPLPVPSPSPRLHRPRRSRRHLIRSSPPVDVTPRRHTPPAAPIATTSPEATRTPDAMDFSTASTSSPHGAAARAAC